MKRDGAIEWLAVQVWFRDWRSAPTYRGDRRRWRLIADALRAAGFYSQNTGTIDIPVELIVRSALEMRPQ